MNNPAPNSTPIRILLVEDHVDSAFVMRLTLERKGYVVSVAYTVAEAIRCASSERFEVLISDIMLPDGTGWDVVRQVRALQPVVAIALSALVTDADIDLSHDAGFERHLKKPTTATVLQATIDELITARLMG